MAKINVNVQPFTTPNFVTKIRPKGVSATTEMASFPLADVDAETLSRMCDEFRTHIFSKAKQKDPRL